MIFELQTLKISLDCDVQRGNVLVGCRRTECYYAPLIAQFISFFLFSWENVMRSFFKYSIEKICSTNLHLKRLIAKYSPLPPPRFSFIETIKFRGNFALSELFSRKHQLVAFWEWETRGIAYPDSSTMSIQAKLIGSSENRRISKLRKTLLFGKAEYIRVLK